MKHDKAREKLSKEELLGGVVCISCHEFTPKGEDKKCGCPVGGLGIYDECGNCGDVYFDDGGPGMCRDCSNQMMNLIPAKEDIQKKDWILQDDSVEIPEPYSKHELELHWTTETYIAQHTLAAAFEDDDVRVGSVRSESDRPVVELVWTGA